MLVYIDLEHPDLEHIDPLLWARVRQALIKKKYQFEALSGLPCLIVRYDRVSPAYLDEVGARALFVSGCSLEFEHYAPNSFAGLRDIYLVDQRPLLAFCGGMQLLAETFGAAIGPISPVHLPPASRPRLTIEENPQVVQELGFQTMQKQQDHPLLHGLPADFSIFQAHYWEVKTVPAGFEVLASSAVCAIQVLAHQQRSLFGMQCHPEVYDSAHPHGRQVIENFLQIAGICQVN